MTTHTDRRQFLQQTLVAGASTAVAASAPHGWLHALAHQAAGQERILIVIQLTGGNDGLNTVVPYADEAYRRARPKLAIAADSVVKINDALGLHSALKSSETALTSNRLGVVQGVGYQQPNRSHFESMDIWHTCQRKTERVGQGWLGGWLSDVQKSTTDSRASLALHLGQEQQPLALAGRDITVPSIASLKQFRLRLGDGSALKEEVMRLTQNRDDRAAPDMRATAEARSELLDFVQSSTQTALEASRRLEAATSGEAQSDAFPASPLSEKLHIISQLIVSGFSTRVYYVTLDGFDTHAQQPLAHAALLRQWSEAQAALLKVLEERGHADRVLVMTFSEFGRRVAENASDGTDHGAAAPVFLAGPTLKSPVFGAHPSLSDLDDGDLKFHTDFRSVYATVIEKWFAADSKKLLGSQYPTLDIFS